MSCSDDQREESAQRFVAARMLRRLAPRRIGDEKGQPQADGQNGCGIKEAQAPCDRGACQLRRDAGSEDDFPEANLPTCRYIDGYCLPCPTPHGSATPPPTIPPPTLPSPT